MRPAISLGRVTRRYRSQLALDDVAFDVEPGSITGLLGRDGAGRRRPGSCGHRHP